MPVTWKKLAYEIDVILKTLMSGKGDIIYASAANTPARLAVGADNQILKVNVDVPNWEAETDGFLKARAYRNAAQTIVRITWSKVLIDTDSFDPANITDLVNNRILPTTAGYYLATGHVAYGDMNAGAAATCAIYVNGTVVSMGNRFYTAVVSPSYLTICDLVYLDGIDDYVELWTYHNSDANEALTVGLATINYLSLVGPF